LQQVWDNTGGGKVAWVNGEVIMIDQIVAILVHSLRCEDAMQAGDWGIAIAKKRSENLPLRQVTPLERKRNAGGQIGIGGLQIFVLMLGISAFSAVSASDSVPSMNIPKFCDFTPQPEFPRRAIREGTSGQVSAKFIITNGRVSSIINISGPKVFHEPVTAALQKYRCSSTEAPQVLTQSFNFRSYRPPERRLILLPYGRQYHGETMEEDGFPLPEGEGIEYEANGTVRRQGIWKLGELVEQREIDSIKYAFTPRSEKSGKSQP
jgi:hypothetical protein